MESEDKTEATPGRDFITQIVADEVAGGDSPDSFGGVLLERFGGMTGFGIRRRVTMPCPVVQRFVVSQ